MIRVSDTPFYKLLKTGQTTQYGGYNDDGLYEMGVAKGYDVLTTGVYSGHTHIIMNAKNEPHDNACVYDRRTQLMWSRYLPVVVGPAADGKMPWTTNGAGEGIFAYCGLANAASLAGYTDWRVANIFEILSLPDLEVPDALPNAVAFPFVISGDYYWGSTTKADDVTKAMIIRFHFGYIDAFVKTLAYFLFLVRGG